MKLTLRNSPAWIASKLRPEPSPEWEVELLDPSSRRDRARVRWLSLRPGYRLVDTLPMQLEDLAALQHPATKLQGQALERALVEARRGRPLESCGTYVHYPWKKEVVRVLERDDFVRLRTNRNCYKITPAEQASLGAKTIAVAGLSVGLAVVTTLALERVGGKFHLADFDDLALTNMNRLLAGVAEIGLPKTVIAARRLLELDPYLQVTLFPDGVTRHNARAFLEGVDLLVEECDDLNAKLFLRELARQRRIPVLMQTSEGGLLDVERFDREPSRATLHGLVGSLRSEDVPALSRRDKVPLVSRIIEDGLSDRCAVSMLEIETTLSTWPQLGSAVTAGAGALVDVARRILLGLQNESGRFVFDPTTDLVDGQQSYAVAPSIEAAAQTQAADASTADPRLHTTRAALLEAREGVASYEEIERIVELATRAPSGGNAQAWSFEWASPILRVRLDPTRGTGGLNLDQLANALSLGALTESVVLAASTFGFALEPRAEGPLEGLPENTARWSSVSFDFGRREGMPADPLAEWLAARCTNRNQIYSAPLGIEERGGLQGELAPERLLWFSSAEQLESLGEVLAEGDRFRILHPALHEEMMSELRFPDAPKRTLDDGIETSTMDMDDADLVVLRLWSRPAVAAMLRELDLGRGIYELARKRAKHASAALVLRTEARTFDGFFQAGRELMRLWLRAEARGIAVHPWGALGFLLQHQENDPERAAQSGMEIPRTLAESYRRLVPRRHECGEALLLFLHRAPPPATLARRRPVADVLKSVG